MARCYSVDGTQTIASPADTTVTLGSATTIRPAIYDFYIGSASTPADTAILYTWQRITGLGTGTAVTPEELDSGDPASLSTCAENHTAEPTYTSDALVWNVPINQRATHRANLDPRAPFKAPASANNGFGMFATHASSTVDNTCTFYLEE